jgi:hypothetical protein
MSIPDPNPQPCSLTVSEPLYLKMTKSTYTRPFLITGKHFYLDCFPSFSIQGEEMSGNRDAVNMGFSCKNLDNKDFLGKSDPFLVISRLVDAAFFIFLIQCQHTKYYLKSL